ncbi:MAG: flagellar basal body-associated protein FliL [Sphingobium sp.]
MSEEATAPKKKGGKGKLVMLIVMALVVGAGGTAGGLYATGAFSHAEAKGPKEDPNKPLLVRKGENPVTVATKAVADAGGGSGGGGEGGGNEASIPHVDTDIKVPAAGIDLPRPADASAYQATYYQMPAPYTSNLADTDAFVQVSLAISTFYDARVTDGIKAHETAIRSAILMLLSQEQEAIISTPEGKQALQKKLNDLINKILREKTGYSGVDNVYFTNFVIQ